MERLIALRTNLPTAYIRSAKSPRHGSIALTLISAAIAGSQAAPRAAIARRYTDTGVAATSFATPGWSNPVLSETDYALQLPESGLVYSHHVTTWALAEIALSL
jgi:hypothetical protein